MVLGRTSPGAFDLEGALATTLDGSYLALVLLLGTVWVVANAYQYYPVGRAVVATAIGRLGSVRRRSSPDPVADGSDPPTIDLLLPAYDEAGVIEQAIRSVRAADYPADRLRLHVITEPDDAETRAELRTLSGYYEFSVHEIPEDYPGESNKPRALNYGYARTDAELVGVVDAEDIVAPDLFREVAAAFSDRGCDFALAHLDMANEDDGWLNLLFRAEYGFWYELVVPAFARAGYPVPLGGTSCFFRRDVLAAMADIRFDRYGSPWSISERLWMAEQGFVDPVPWDPQNVTEDFELGLLLWEEGFRFEYLDPVTAEESPVDLDGWLDQRVRWQKGKLQTLVNYWRHPPPTGRRKGHILWQSMLPHLGPVNVLGAGLIFWLAVVVGVRPGPYLRGLLGLGLAFVLVAVGVFTAGYWAASDRPVHLRLRRALVVGATVPGYWLLQWLADIHALVDLHRGRLQWITSEHLGRHVGTPPVAAAAYAGRPTLPAALSPRQVALGLSGVLAAAAAVRTVRLDRWSLWHDEIYTITVRGGAPLAELVTMTTDPHPPLYYAITHGWMAVGGSSPVAMRSLSVLFSVGTVAAVFLLGRAVYDDRTGLLAALLVTVSTTHVHFGRTVRMYSLFTMLAALSWYAYVTLRTDGCCFEWLGRPTRRHAVGYVLVSALLLYTHVYGLFVIASQHLVRALSTNGRVDDRLWWPAQVALAVLFAPWAVVLGGQLVSFADGADASPIAWIPPPSVGQFRETVLLLGGYPSFYPVDAGSTLALGLVVAVLFAMTVAVLFSVVTYGYEPELTYYLIDGRQAAMLGLFTVGLFIPLGLSYLVVPMFVPRYAIAAGVPFAVLVARGLQHIPERRWRLLLVGVIIAGSLATTGLYYSSGTAADWRGASTHLSAEASPTDLVVFQPTWIQEDVDYYAPELAGDRYALRPDDQLAEGDLDRLRALAADRETVWLVRHEGADTERAQTTLEATHRPVSVYDGGVITVHRFERRV